MSIPSTGNLVDVYRLPAFSLEATPDAPFNIAWRTEKNGPGTGTFSIPLDDTAYPDIEVNDLATIRVDGRWRSFIIERIEERLLDPAGESAQVAVCSGRGVEAMFEWAIVWSSIAGNNHQPVEEDVVFDARSIRYDSATYSDTWDPATEVDSVTDAEAGSWPQQPMASLFDLTVGAQMIDISGSTTTLAEPWWRMFIRDITIAVPGRYGLEMLMDNLGKFYVDGVEMYDVRDEDGFVTASFKRLELSAATHRFAWVVFNKEDELNPGEGQGPAALAYNLYKADLQDFYLDGGDRWISDDSTEVHYIGEDILDMPSMTVGDILLQLLAEADARGSGTLGWITPTFDELLDSDGASWPRNPGITTKTGTSVLQFLDELVAAAHISHWRLRPDGVTFDVFAPGYTSDPSVTLAPATGGDPNTGQLVELTRIRT